jgi:tRNA1Val (adenine37-N6)-methyltransferase
LPPDRALAFEKMAEKYSFSLIQKLEISHSPSHKSFRTILHMGRKETDQKKITTLIIRDQSGNYSVEFIKLMKDYYLYL